MSELREKLAEAQFDQIDFYPWAEAEPMTWEEAKRRDTEDRKFQFDEAYLRADAAMKVFAETVGHNEGVPPQVLRNLADLYGDVIGTLMAAHLRRAAARLELLDFIAATLKDQSHE